MEDQSHDKRVSFERKGLVTTSPNQGETSNVSAPVSLSNAQSSSTVDAGIQAQDNAGDSSLGTESDDDFSDFEDSYVAEKNKDESSSNPYPPKLALDSDSTSSSRDYSSDESSSAL
jgi:hypothetical protein